MRFCAGKTLVPSAKVGIPIQVTQSFWIIVPPVFVRTIEICFQTLLSTSLQLGILPGGNISTFSHSAHSFAGSAGSAHSSAGSAHSSAGSAHSSASSAGSAQLHSQMRPGMEMCFLPSSDVTFIFPSFWL